MREVVKDSTLLIAGAVVALLAAMALTGALAAGLTVLIALAVDMALAVWLGPLATAVLLGCVAGALFLAGRRRLQKAKLQPEPHQTKSARGRPMAEKTASVRTHDQSPEALRNEIAETRSRISGTLDVLQHRLSPHSLKQRAIQTMKDKSRETGYRMRDSIRENPWPLLITGAGMSWMIASLTRDVMQGTPAHHEHEVEPHEAEHRTTEAKHKASARAEELKAHGRETAHRMRNRAEEMGHHAQQRASELGHQFSEQMSETASYVRGQAREQSRHAMETAKSTYETHPLTTGLATLAAGFALGLLIPPSRKEQEWMGASSHEMMEEAKEYGQDLIERGKEVAKETYATAKDEAREQAEEFTHRFSEEPSPEEQKSEQQPPQQERTQFGESERPDV